MNTHIGISTERCLLKIAGHFDLETVIDFRTACRRLLAECPCIRTGGRKWQP